MKFSTLCYIEKDNKYLMLYRNKKKKDINKNKWIGVGGHFETGESPDECLLREVKEETNLTLVNYKLRSIITFICDGYEDECIFLYTANNFEGDLIECNEGELRWIDKKDIFKLNLWDGDKIFLNKLINNYSELFMLKLVYDKDNNLIEAMIDNNKIDL